MGCSGSKNQAAVEPLPNASSHSSKKKYGKLASPRVPPGMGPSFPTHTDMGSPPPPDHSHDNCNAAHRSPPSSYSPYEQKMVEQHEKLMQHQQHHEPMDIADRPDFVVPIPLPDPFHPRIVTEISNPRHVPRPYPQLGNYDPTASAKRSKSRNMILVLGGPGCGKDTFCPRLAAEFGFTHFSVGDLVRAEAHKGTSLGVRCGGLVKEGQLASTADVMNLVETALFATSSRNFLVEGFPRSTDQAKEFEELLGKPKLVIYLECSQKELERRLSKRAKSSARTDETPEAVAARLQNFCQVSLPVVNYYEKSAPSLLKKISVDGLLRSDDKVFSELSQAVNDVFFPMSSKTTFVLVLGGPGCGKGTQCGLLAEDFGFHHLSTGDLLREEIKKGTEIGKKCEKLIKDGKLVSLAVILQLLQRAIIVAQRKSFLIDGIKTAEQAKEFDTKVGKPTAVIYLSCSPEVMEERLNKRAQTSGRSDDNPKTIKKRLDAHNTDSKVLIEYYKKTVPDAFSEVAADRPEAEIYEEVRAIVEKKTKKATKADKQM